MIDICSIMTDLDLFLISQGTLPWQPVKFTLLERVVFAAIRPQFDDDLHSSP